MGVQIKRHLKRDIGSVAGVFCSCSCEHLLCFFQVADAKKMLRKIGEAVDVLWVSLDGSFVHFQGTFVVLADVGQEDGEVAKMVCVFWGPP